MFSSNVSFPRRNYGGSTSTTTYNYTHPGGEAPNYAGATSGRAFPSMDELRLSEQAREFQQQNQLASRQQDAARYGIDVQDSEFNQSLADQQAARRDAIAGHNLDQLKAFSQAQLARAQSLPHDNKGDIAAYLAQYQQANEDNLMHTAASGIGPNVGDDVMAQGAAARSRALGALLGIRGGTQVGMGNSGQLALQQQALDQQGAQYADQSSLRKQAADSAFMQWLSSQSQNQQQAGPQQGPGYHYANQPPLIPMQDSGNPYSIQMAGKRERRG